MFKKIIVFLLIAAAIGSAVGYYMWHKPPRTAEDEKPFVTISADALFTEFSADEVATTTKYINKVLEVTGKVSDIKKDASGNTDVILETSDILGTVVCTLKNDANADGTEIGTTVALKGICTGYLTDVILNQGVVVKKNPQ
jgi:hypothetical protein